MVARGPGAVGCAHCRVIGADRPCLVCKKLVCERCAADWATCDEPSGRRVKLGFSGRLRDVDPSGALGLVSHWRRGPRLLDLRRLRWVPDGEFPRPSYAVPPRLVDGGRLLVRGPLHAYQNATVYAVFQQLPGGEPAQLSDVLVSHLSGVSYTGDRYWFVTPTQRVAIAHRLDAVALPAEAAIVRVAHASLPPAWHVTEHEPLPRKVIQAAYVDGDRALLAATSWGELALHRIAGDRLELIDYAKTERQGDVTWVAVAGPWLAVAVGEHGTAMQLEVYPLAPDLTLGKLAHRHAGPIHAASLSRDGRHLAFGTDLGLVVHALDTTQREVFDDHTGRIELVRFAAGDHTLISADTGNRAILRPRHAGGYAQPLLQVTVADAPLAASDG